MSKLSIEPGELTYSRFFLYISFLIIFAGAEKGTKFSLINNSQIPHCPLLHGLFLPLLI
jgi:hypothetical protein